MFLLKYKKIYDLRSTTEILKYGKIPTSVQASLPELKYKFQNNIINKNDKILIYCSSAKRSSYGLYLADFYGYKNIDELKYGFNVIRKFGLGRYKKILKL